MASRPTIRKAPPITTTGAATIHRQVRLSLPGLRSRPAMIATSARMKTMVVKQKIVTGSSGRAAAENCGSASPRKIDSAKPCVP